MLLSFVLLVPLMASPRSQPVDALVADAKRTNMAGEFAVAEKMLSKRIGKIDPQKPTGEQALLTAELANFRLEQHAYSRPDYERVVATLEEAERLAAKANDRRADAVTSFVRARLLYWEKMAGRGDWPTVRAAFDKSLQLRESINDEVGVAESRFFLGLIHQWAEEWPQAMEQWNAGLKIAEEHNDAALQSYFVRHMGGYYEEAKRLNEAEAAFRKSLKLREQSGYKMLVPFAMILLADFLAEERGQTAQSLKMFEQAIALAEKSHAGRAKILGQIAFGKLVVKTGDVKRGKQQLQQARDTATAFKIGPMAEEASAELAKIDKR